MVHPTSTPILMYHSVSRASSAAFAPFVVSPEAFDGQLSCLEDLGLRPLTVARFATSLRQGEPTDDAVVLTFDDAFADFLHQALPILDAHHMSATLFVPTAFVGATSRWLVAEGEQGREMLSWSELRAVRDAGVEIGAHSHNHVELDRVPRDAMVAEVGASKACLEEALGIGVESFAYPFGYHDRQVRRAVRSAGYRAACQVGHAYSERTDDLYALNRILVPADATPQEFRTLLTTRPSFVQRELRRAREAGATIARRLRPARQTGAV